MSRLTRKLNARGPKGRGSASRLILSAWLAAATGLAAADQAGQVPETRPAEERAAAVQTPEVTATGLDGDSGSLPSARLRQTRKLEDYRDAIARLEAEQGAWGAGLAEQLGGLGRTYQIRGYHRDAIKIFERAIHISRINNGLYDLGQVPIIERMLESLSARGRREEVHERHQYLYWLHKRNYGAQDPRMLPVIDRLGKWYINDYALNPDDRMMEQLVSAHDLFEHAIGIISGTYGQEDLRLIEPLRGLVMSNWYFANYRGEGPTNPLERERLTREMGADGVAFPDDRESNRLAQYLRNNYAEGKRAIERMVEIYASSPDAPPGAEANAKVELADWQQLFSRYNSAKDLYQEAYRELTANGETQSQAEKLFGQPVALPDLDLVESDLEQSARRTESSEGESAEPLHYVLVSFDVNRFGEAEHIDILESQPNDGGGYLSRVKRSLENTRFRPRLVDGEPVDTQGLTQKYVFTTE